jgi:hypothetical protein
MFRVEGQTDGHDKGNSGFLKNFAHAPKNK